jgi:hypothetical protein
MPEVARKTPKHLESAPTRKEIPSPQKRRKSNHVVAFILGAGVTASAFFALNRQQRSSEVADKGKEARSGGTAQRTPSSCRRAGKTSQFGAGENQPS